MGEDMKGSAAAAGEGAEGGGGVVVVRGAARRHLPEEAKRLRALVEREHGEEHRAA